MRELGMKTGTDKVQSFSYFINHSLIFGDFFFISQVTHHGYDRFYPLFLEPHRETPAKLLEIGHEEESYKMWAEYFARGACVYCVCLMVELLYYYVIFDQF